ncbi:unnamed protein product [Gordionus sp. m RMFG-2023]
MKYRKAKTICFEEIYVGATVRHPNFRSSLDKTASDGKDYMGFFLKDNRKFNKGISSDWGNNGAKWGNKGVFEDSSIKPSDGLGNNGTSIYKMGVDKSHTAPLDKMGSLDKSKGTSLGGKMGSPYNSNGRSIGGKIGSQNKSYGGSHGGKMVHLDKFRGKSQHGKMGSLDKSHGASRGSKTGPLDKSRRKFIAGKMGSMDKLGGKSHGGKMTPLDIYISDGKSRGGKVGSKNKFHAKSHGGKIGSPDKSYRISIGKIGSKPKSQKFGNIRTLSNNIPPEGQSEVANEQPDESSILPDEDNSRGLDIVIFSRSIHILPLLLILMLLILLCCCLGRAVLLYIRKKRKDAYAATDAKQLLIAKPSSSKVKKSTSKVGKSTSTDKKKSVKSGTGTGKKSSQPSISKPAHSRLTKKVSQISITKKPRLKGSKVMLIVKDAPKKDKSSKDKGSSRKSSKDGKPSRMKSSTSSNS